MTSNSTEDYESKHLVSIRDICRKDIEDIIELATAFKRQKNTGYETTSRNSSRKIASLFFENSTRTRVSFDTAANNLGFHVNGFSGSEGTSIKKGEPLLDSVRMFAGYGYNGIVMRHHLAGAARFLADNLKIPIINAGDGSSGHPTQTLLDLFTIFEKFGHLDNIKIGLVGDLRYGRTVHSLLQAAELFDMKMYSFSPPNLQMPNWRIKDYESLSGKKLTVTETLEEILSSVDVLYVTRIQRERFAAGPEGEAEFKKCFGQYSISREVLERYAKKNLMVLHPLPRDKNNIEIHPNVDATPYAYYFKQAENGLYTRMAIIDKLLNGSGFLYRRYPERNKLPSWRELPIKNGQKSGEKLLYRLDEGTLIDHLQVDQAPLIYKLLGLNSSGRQNYSNGQNDSMASREEVVLCSNIRSEKMGRKDVLAIHKLQLSPEQLYKVALLSPKHTINIIRNKVVVQKLKAILPSPLKDLIICNNPLCISRSEHFEYAGSIFYPESQDPLQVRCHYCEQLHQMDQISFGC